MRKSTIALRRSSVRSALPPSTNGTAVPTALDDVGVVEGHERELTLDVAVRVAAFLEHTLHEPLGSAAVPGNVQR